MNPRKAVPAAALLAMTLMATACGAQEDGPDTGGNAPKQVVMNEQQAIARAEEIIGEAVDGMSPRPTLERMGPAPVGPCLAHDDHRPDDRVQVTLIYKLTGVPGTQAQNLVRQARDAWRKHGYVNQSGEQDWETDYPAVYMRTKADDFWMNAVTGVLDRARKEGLASLKVTSPCFLPPDKASSAADPAAFEPQDADDPAARRALGHSSRIYDVLRAGSAPAQPGEGLSRVPGGSGAAVHHTWSTPALPEDERLRVVERARAYFAGEGWRVRPLPTADGHPGVVAGHPEEHTVAQVVVSATGTVRVAVTTPVDGTDSAEA
ncbi:hypothetical protein [Streptomyces roseicoloratus]|uniref:hypothetical protein n=1 Tax=Streptomyces roseicoloratus TaxID=2508722 RepID=UPI001009B9D4|nr:hypothetical protein [Streptomyces roseicoloratus]